ncbi:uncharacterized protein LOC142767393 isoform X1 [Rhipicephalus microplus]|uniref:uncharacterized protein LOC142767393 isoform X1 n=1 Tax=Rhipicephalus microplus TaxID=6941 RepID=UPI003F6A5D0D
MRVIAREQNDDTWTYGTTHKEPPFAWNSLRTTASFVFGIKSPANLCTRHMHGTFLQLRHFCIWPIQRTSSGLPASNNLHRSNGPLCLVVRSDAALRPSISSIDATFKPT